MKKLDLETERITLNNQELVDIHWEDGTKGVLLKTKKGFCVLNNNSRSIKKAVVRRSVQDYVMDSIENDHVGDVYTFNSLVEMYNWFTNNQQS